MINYDFPNSTEDYVHRIGRTARADKSGTAYTFFTQGDSKAAGELIDVLMDAHQEVPEKLRSFASSAQSRGGMPKSIISYGTNIQSIMGNTVLSLGSCANEKK